MMESNRMKNQQGNEGVGVPIEGNQIGKRSSEGIKPSEANGQKSQRFQMTRMTFNVYRFTIDWGDGRDGPESSGCLVKPKR